MSSKPATAIAKACSLFLVLTAASIVLPRANAQSLASLPAIPAQMACTLQAFQALSLNGVADDLPDASTG